MEFIKEHWVLSIMFTIILGAIGSGLWETVFKPISLKTFKIIYGIITFGTKRASNQIYKEAARGHHEVASLNVLLFVIVFAIGFLIIIHTTVYFTVSAIDTKDNTVVNKCLDKETSILINDCKQKELKKLISKLEKKQNQLRSEFFTSWPYIILISIFASVMLLYRFSLLNLSNLTITYFKHCVKVCAPFISNKERLIFEQKFALVKDKASFEVLSEELKVIAKENNIDLPKSYI